MNTRWCSRERVVVKRTTTNVTADSSERTKHTKKKNEPPKKTHQFGVGVDGERDRGLSRGCFRDRFRQPVLSHACDDKRSRSVRFCRSRALNEPKREKERNVIVIIILILILRVKEFETHPNALLKTTTHQKGRRRRRRRRKRKRRRAFCHRTRIETSTGGAFVLPCTSRGWERTIPTSFSC